MPRARDVELLDASIPRTETLLAAARTLCSARLSAIAVLDENERVVGFFTEDDLVAGLFPRYLRELHHTAFLDDDPSALARHAHAAASEPVEKHMRRAVTVAIDASLSHLAERFLHSEWGAVAVVDGERFAGMLRQLDFCSSLLAGLEQP